ncbi:MAG: NAD(P)/FAD-dependent oxidoreductase [Alphaproteobacteria bacterium]|nr:NAD(P)/FAD-dependent oxidoreductase [Alphaproteobacteria bacterium]
MQYDTIVIGAGHNGLAAAILLAKQGKSVLVLEKNAVPGGMAANGEIAAGVAGPQLAHLLGGLGKSEIDALDLKRHGLNFAARSIPTVVLDEGGRHILLDGDDASFADGVSHPDAEAFRALRKRMARFGDKLATLTHRPPPRLDGLDLGEAASLAKLAFGIRGMGKADAREFLRVLLSNAYDAILDEIDDGPLAGALGIDAVMGGHIGPRSPGTVLTMMYRLIGGGARHVPQGGVGGALRAFEKSAQAAGAEIRCGAGVRAISVEDDRVTGVVLEDGSEIAAGSVLSSLDPRSTMMLAGPAHFDAEMVRRIRKIRAKGCTAKVNLVLDAAPRFAGLTAGHMAGRLLVTPSLDRMELAFNRAKYGELPDDPVLEVTIPTLSDPSLARDGKHIVSVVVQYTPYELKEGWSDKTRAALADIVIDTLARYDSGLGGHVVGTQILTPMDIERMTGAPGGHWHHGEMIADQMLMLRPAPGIDRYALPVGGLFLCGASCHPGGDVTALPGCNAARIVLADEKRRVAA